VGAAGRPAEACLPVGVGDDAHVQVKIMAHAWIMAHARIMARAWIMAQAAAAFACVYGTSSWLLQQAANTLH